MRTRGTGSAISGRGPQEPTGQRLARSVAEELRAGRGWPGFVIEEYGPDGEILEASESPEVVCNWGGSVVYIVTGTGYEEPKTDWRERGVVPPRGFHRYGEGGEA